jgi:metal-dependent amidase/aminoacylase/carboxypeptidase family protein
MPIVTVLDDESTPATINDPALSARLQKIFVAKLGAENVIEKQAIMGSEDVGILSVERKIPTVIFWLGAYDPAKVAESERTGVPLPSPHSPFFAPLPEPTLRTGVTAMTDAAVALLQ